VATLDWDGDDFGDLIRVKRLDRLSERLKASGGRLDEKERFSGPSRLVLPPKQRLNVWQDVHARRQPLADECVRKRLGVSLGRTRDKHDKALCH